MKYIYPAFFYEENEGGYSVLFPDFPCGTCGKDLAEAHYMAVDFLYCVISGMIEDGEKPPSPSDIKRVTPADDWEYKSVFSSLVSVDTKEYAKYLDEQSKAIRKNITIPKWLGELADNQHINYSAILQEALKKQLGV
ncbi:MAG: type II toxin-antitoxin system HicB family antitoxin [Firmicutes bacterium]|nr:type II toxin-antitoxin system HicB family antitoxin [Bacillota bacterium]